jgi:hypothetical protein
MGRIGDDIVTVLVAIIGLATVAVLVGNRAKTSAVIDSAGTNFVNAIKAAVSPVV